ncbi:MAG: hypothetical protein AAB472_03080 [Patescibacteria group bacterium]
MGKAVTRGQALTLVGQFSQEIRWDELTSEEVQTIIDLAPKERMVRYTTWLKSLAESLKSPASVPAQKVASRKVPPLFTDAMVTALADGSFITVLSPVRDAKFVEWLSSVLGVPVHTPYKAIVKLLKERGYLVGSAHIEEMTDLTDRGKMTGMCTNGYSNFYPSRDKYGSVFIGRVYPGMYHWMEGRDEWSDRLFQGTQCRLLVRNLDPVTLGL